MSIARSFNALVEWFLPPALRTGSPDTVRRAKLCVAYNLAVPLWAPGFAVLQRTLGEVFPGIVVAPNILSGGTDTKHYQGLSRNVYRFVPMRLGEGDISRFHGTNERVAVDNYADAVRFYAQLVRNTAGAQAGGGVPRL